MTMPCDEPTLPASPPPSLVRCAAVKVLLTSLFFLYHDWSGVEAEKSAMTQSLSRLAEDLQDYLMPPRFYSQYYPYLGFRAAMVRRWCRGLAFLCALVGGWESVCEWSALAMLPSIPPSDLPRRPCVACLPAAAPTRMHTPPRLRCP